MLKSFASLRSRAIFLVLLTVLPLLALMLYSYFDQRARTIREVQRDELVAARNLATLQEVLIRDTRQLLQTLSRLPQVQRLDRNACNALFDELLKQNPHYAVIGGVDPAGWTFASAPPVSQPVNVADRLWFQKAVQTRDFFAGEPLLGRVSGKYSFNMSSPILDDRGRLQGVLTVSLDLHWLGSLLIRSDFPPTTALALIDSNGTTLFRYPEPLKYTGRMMPDLLIKAINRRDEGVLEVVGLPGDVRLVGFTRLSPP